MIRYKLEPGAGIDISGCQEGLNPDLRGRLNAGETVELTPAQAQGVAAKVVEVKEKTHGNK